MARRDTSRELMAVPARAIVFLIGLAISVALLPAAAFAVVPALEAGTLSKGIQQEQVTPQSTLTTCASAKTVKAARKAYKRYLEAHSSVRHFKVVNMGNGGVPVLLCSKQKPFTNMSPDFFITVDVVIYDKTKSAKVKNIGTVTTGGTAFQLHFSKNTLNGYRLGGLHTFGVVTVKHGRLSVSGMFDGEYLPDLNWRHFSDYNPRSKTPLWESKALGKKGTKKQYNNLMKKYGYGKHPLKLHKNNSSNRAKYV